MPAVVTCACCRRPLRVPESALGQLVRCPLCHDTFVADAAALAAEPAPEAPPPEPPREEAPPPPLPVLTALPAADEPPRRRPREVNVRRVHTLRFTAVVTYDLERTFEGPWDAEVTRDGLFLRREEAELLVPVGDPVRHLGGNRLEVRLEGRDVVLQVRRPRSDLTRLTRDLAFFLDGQCDRPRAAEYGVPAVLYLTPLLLLGVPVIGLAARLLGGGWVGALVWGGVTAFFAALSVLAVTRGTWQPLGRFAAVGALLTAAYGALFCAFVFELIVPPTTFAASDWQTFAPPGENYRVRMPGKAKSEPQFRDGVRVSAHVVECWRQKMAFSVCRTDLPPGPRDRGALEEAFRGGKQGMLAETPGSTVVRERDVTHRGHPGREWVLRVSNYKFRGDVVARMYVVGHQLFVLVVAGPRLDPDTPAVRQFFDSLEVGPPAPAWPVGK